MFLSGFSVSHGGHVGAGDVAGLARGQVNHLVPGLAHRDHLQLVPGHQPTDGLGGLVGLHPQAHAPIRLSVQRLRRHVEGRHAAEVVFPLGDLLQGQERFYASGGPGTPFLPGPSPPAPTARNSSL